MRHNFYLTIFGVLALFSFGISDVFAQSPSIFFSAPPKQVREGQRLTLDVKIQSSAQSINAISGVFTFPTNLVNVTSVSKEGSIISIWTREPKISRGQISFEGIILNPGFQGGNGTIFRINLEAKQTGTAFINFIEGAILANDGLGTNVLTKLGATNFRIVPGSLVLEEELDPTYPPRDSKLSALPVITDYSPQVESKEGFYVKGKGEPKALTKIIFKDIATKSVGEQLIALLLTEKKKIDEVLVTNTESGEFQYVSAKNLVAGVYNATPFLVDEDTNTEKPGFGVQLLVSDSKIVKGLVVLINVLGLLIPVVILGVIIYFIPWYSFKRMRVIKKRLGLEEEKLDLSEHQLQRQDKIAERNINNLEKDIQP